MPTASFIAFGCAAGYLLALSVVGHVYVVGLIKVRYARHRGIAGALLAVHFVLGIAGVIVVPALAYRMLRTQLPSEFGIGFGLTGLLSLGLAFWVAKAFNRVASEH